MLQYLQLHIYIPVHVYMYNYFYSSTVMVVYKCFDASVVTLVHDGDFIGITNLYYCFVYVHCL